MENLNSGNVKNNSIIIPDSDFDFNQLHLADPISVQGGSYFTKITKQQSPLYIQSPRCVTKQGFVKSGKKIHTDVVFNNNDDTFIQWLIDLETKCEDLIYQKSNDWFQSPLELDDIQSAFNSCVKVQKTGNYIVRTNIKLNSLTQEPLIRIYNESESMLTMDDVIPDTSIIVILEIRGVRFTTRNFQLDVEMKQVMVLNKDLFENCLIRPSNPQIQSHQDGITDKSNLEDPSVLTNDNINDKIKSSDQYDDGEQNIDEQQSDESDEDSEDGSIEKLTLGELVTLDSVDMIDSYNQHIGSVDIKENGSDLATANILSENMNSLEKSNEKTQKEKLQSLEFDVDNSDTNEINTSEVEKQEDTVENNVSLETLNKEKELVESILEDIKPTSNNELSEVNIQSDLDNSDILKLKKPSEYYYQLYKRVRETARRQKQAALESYMEAKNIKNTYMLDDISDSSDEVQNIGSDADEDEIEFE